MRRRTLLKAGAGALSLGSLIGTTVSGRPTQESYEPLDSVDIDGTVEVDSVDGETAYVATGDGLTVVDISDPANLTVQAERRGVEIDGQPMRTAWDLWSWDDRVVLAGPAQPNPRGANGFAVFDVSDPAAPELVATRGTEYYIHNCFLDDGLLYLTGSGLFGTERRIPLVVFDVSDDEPEELNRWSPRDHDERWEQVPIGQRVLHDVYVQDGVGYLPYWDSGTWVVDLSDPTAVEVLDRFGDYSFEELSSLSRQEAQGEGQIPDGNAHYTTVDDDGSLLAVGKESWAADGGEVGGPSGVELWDVSDATDAQRLATVEPPESFDQTRRGWFTTAHNCEIDGDRLYTSWYYGGVKVHDVSDPENPEELAWWRDPTQGNFWSAQAGRRGEFFVASSTANLLNRSLPSTRTALFTFPDTAGEQADPVSLLDGPGAAGGGSGTQETDTPAGTDTPTPVPTATATPAGTGTVTPTESDDGSGPGFGVGTTLAALGGGYLLRRHVNDDEE